MPQSLLKRCLSSLFWIIFVISAKPLYAEEMSVLQKDKVVILFEESLTAGAEEVAELFPSPHFHAGLDEAQLGDCPRCKRRGRGKLSWWVFVRHVLAIHKVVTGLGKRMVMWADSVEKHP